MSAIVPPWQEAPLAQLMAVHASGRLPHALLLEGPAGWAKRFFARQLARQLLALPARDGGGDLWGTESADSDLLAHPDARIIQRTPSPTTGRMRQQITVDQIRELGEFLVRTAGGGGARLAIVELAEDLNVNAANALLKRLEEPGARTHLLLVTAHASRVLPTVRSRCQRVPLPPGDTASARAWLQGRLPESAAGDAERLLELAGGAPLRALEFVERGAVELAREVDAVLAGEAPDKLIGADQRLEGDVARDRAALIMELIWRAVANRARSRAGGVDATADRGADASMAGAGAQRTLQQFLDRVTRAQRQLASGANPNVTLLLEDLLLGARGLVARN
ncbi:MAG TPA: hypothetical protein VLA56_16285 [Pseudomonadales bacterium]|nr:hypothetical protein [Pseudomonadales bacterium]